MDKGTSGGRVTPAKVRCQPRGAQEPRGESDGEGGGVRESVVLTQQVVQVRGARAGVAQDEDGLHHAGTMRGGVSDARVLGV